MSWTAPHTDNVSLHVLRKRTRASVFICTWLQQILCESVKAAQERLMFIH